MECLVTKPFSKEGECNISVEDAGRLAKEAKQRRLIKESFMSFENICFSLNYSDHVGGFKPFRKRVYIEPNAETSLVSRYPSSERPNSGFKYLREKEGARAKEDVVSQKGTKLVYSGSPRAKRAKTLSDRDKAKRK